MQSKFLNLVEDNAPDDSVDKNTKAKLTVLRALLASSEKVKVKNKQFTNVFFFTDIEGNEYKVSIDNVGVEDNETSNKKVQALTALLNVTTPKITMPGSVASTVKKTQKMALQNLQRDLKK